MSFHDLAIRVKSVYFTLTQLLRPFYLPVSGRRNQHQHLYNQLHTRVVSFLYQHTLADFETKSFYCYQIWRDFILINAIFASIILFLFNLKFLTLLHAKRQFYTGDDSLWLIRFRKYFFFFFTSVRLFRVRNGEK